MSVCSSDAEVSSYCVEGVSSYFVLIIVGELVPFQNTRSRACADRGFLVLLASGVTAIEEDALRYHVAARPLQAEQLSAVLRKLQQDTPMQPYGLASVEANLFTITQRSTTSSVDPTTKFRVCIIGEY